MKYPLRLGLFLVGAIGLAILYGLAIARMPGEHESLYGRLINQLSQPQQHIRDAVTAVNFDYRGFDTLGEEFILFISVTGAIVLLRETYEKKKEEQMDAITPGRAVSQTDAVRTWTLALTGPTVVFGVYIVIHGQLTPGGGFQGGVVLATAPLLIYLGESFEVFKRVTSTPLIEITEAIGAGGYAIIGIIGWLAGSWFLQNVFPLGDQNNPSVFTGGTVPAINLATGIEVTAGFTLLLSAFLQQTLADRGDS
ncbi:MAG TPA: MnhB domain-containing protein [Tepidisphaeraceae bacterium]|nr:MnhB domain-containing protein [Tepidisphaeraceae bacterium]